MASLPARQLSQRRASPEQSSRDSAAPASPSQRPRSQSRARSTISEDSQTVLLNNPSPIEGTKEQQAAPASLPRPRPQDEPDVKKCWICFSDETEDTYQTSQWRSPCPCALVAHEECLLDWIADLESPSSRKRTLGPPQFLCPQCKSQIHLARPHDPLVEAVRALERIAAKAVTPFSITVAMSAVYVAFYAHGESAIWAIFGERDGERILEPLLTRPHTLPEALHDFMDNWRLRIGLPLIPSLLVLSRTTLADSALPVLPIVFFATQGDAAQPLDFGHWPPSASLALAVLPYFRSIYNTYYDRVWAAHEKRWLKDVQPRQSSQDDNDGQAQEAEAEPAEGENVFEIRVDGNIWDDWDGAADEPEQQPERGAMAAERDQIRQDMLQNGPAPGLGAPEQAPPLDAPPLADDQLEAAPQAANEPQHAAQQPRPQQQQQQQQQPQQAAAERRLSFSTTALAEKVLGALMFPTIASLSGDALKSVLPTSWTTASRGKATGLLQEKWGRSIVGGCLFVVFKDAVMLYVRWKMAQQHRSRRVLNYDRKKGKAVGR